MKIGFVAEPYEEQHASGMGYLVRELMKNLVLEGNGHEFVFYSSKKMDRTLIPGTYANVIIPKGFIKQFFYFLRLRDNIDVLFFIAPLLPLSIPRRIQPVVICQELLSQKIQPRGFRDILRAYVRDTVLMPQCVRRATFVVAASKATQTDILQYYRIPENKVPVIYDGFQNLSRFKNSLLAADSAMEPYFFWTGKVKYRKNVHGLVAAFISFKKRTGADCKLIIAGDYGGDYHRGLLKALDAAGLSKNVFFLGYVSSEQLYVLYKHALAFVFPSINEGFGMPLLEAMSVGTPVLTSSISSMAEVAGNAALLVDPFDIEEISAGMEKLYYDQAFREELVRKGFERARIFSWPLAARQFLALLN